MEGGKETRGGQDKEGEEGRGKGTVMIEFVSLQPHYSHPMSILCYRR